MDVRIKNAKELTSKEIADWRTLQKSDPALISPFFSPDFTLAIGAARDDVSVAIVNSDDAATGFFPFHRTALGVGAPIGGPICDYHGVIGSAQETSDIGGFLKACGLTAYDFNHHPSANSPFTRGAFLETSSPYLDLSDGYDSYVAGRTAAKTKELKNTERKRRKIEREMGPLRFEPNDKSDAAWEAMVRWKNISYEKLGVSSILDVDWVMTALKAIRDTENEDFSGMLSTLYVGDQLAAAHFGMRSHASWHWWFPTYDIALDKYSPGLILLMELARHGPEISMTRIDLGRGDSRYKKAFASAATPLCEGSVEVLASAPGAARALRKIIHRSMAMIPPLEGPTDFQRRVFNRLLGAGRLPD